MRKNNCRICGEPGYIPFLDLGEQPHCNSFLDPSMTVHKDWMGVEPKWPLELVFCPKCTLVQLNYAVDKNVMFRNYPYVSGTTKTLNYHFKKCARDLIKKHRLPLGSLVVDIGSNDGTFLSHFKEQAMLVTGVDPAQNIVSLARKKGIPTKNEYFGEDVAREIKKTIKPASLITAAGVFFHIDDMRDVCQGINTLLADDGVLHVQAIYLGSMLEKTSYDNVYHEHVSYYTLKSLKALLDTYDLEIFDVSLNPIHGGSLMVDAGRPGKHPVQNSVFQRLKMEAEKGWDKLEAYLEFAKRVKQQKSALVEMLTDLRARGLKIMAYGAPAKGNTLLNYCELGTDLLECAVEKAPLKIGKVTPGMHLPVKDEEQVMKHPPDYFLLLPWNFQDELVEKNQNFLEKGGKFIVPVPMPQVIEAKVPVL